MANPVNNTADSEESTQTGQTNETFDSSEVTQLLDQVLRSQITLLNNFGKTGILQSCLRELIKVGVPCLTGFWVWFITDAQYMTVVISVGICMLTLSMVDLMDRRLSGTILMKSMELQIALMKTAAKVNCKLQIHKTETEYKTQVLITDRQKMKESQEKANKQRRTANKEITKAKKEQSRARIEIRKAKKEQQLSNEEQKKANTEKIKAKKEQSLAREEQRKAKIEKRKAEKGQILAKEEQRKAEKETCNAKKEQLLAKEEQTKAKIAKRKLEEEQLLAKEKQRKTKEDTDSKKKQKKKSGDEGYVSTMKKSTVKNRKEVRTVDVYSSASSSSSDDN